jgi:hypothetical protein
VTSKASKEQSFGRLTEINPHLLCSVSPQKFLHAFPYLRFFFQTPTGFTSYLFQWRVKRFSDEFGSRKNKGAAPSGNRTMAKARRRSQKGSNGLGASQKGVAAFGACSLPDDEQHGHGNRRRPASRF